MSNSLLSVLKMVEAGSNRKTVLSQSALQHFAEQILLLGGEFLALRSQIENIDGFLALGINQCDFNIAGKSRQSGAHVVKKTGAILNDHFEQSAVSGGGIVEVEACLHRHFRRAGASGSIAAFEQGVGRGFCL